MSKSGRQIGDEYVERFKAYAATVDAFPSRDKDGKYLNLSSIALRCGIDRGRFHTNPHLKAELQRAIVEKGLRWVGEAPPSHTDDETRVRLERRITELENANATLMAENADLRTKLRRYLHIEKHMIDTGRLARG